MKVLIKIFQKFIQEYKNVKFPALIGNHADNIFYSLNKGIYGTDEYDKKTDVYLCGVLSDVCVEQAMYGFLKKGANVIVIEDLCKGLNHEITEILESNRYRKFVENGRLKSITTQQFFRKELLNKKIEHNMVRR